MSQPVHVMAFRKRAMKCGYSGIKIYRICNDQGVPTGRYSVSAVEPLAGIPVYGEFDQYDLCHKFRH